MNQKEKVLFRRKEEDIMPLWDCPYCKGSLEIVDKEECSALDSYKACSNCGRNFVETWIIESIKELF